MTQGKKFLVLVGIIFCIALFYFIFFNDHSSDLQLIGIVDANQVIVGPKIMGRIEKLAVDEGSEVHAGDLIAQLDTAELQAQQQAATAAAAGLNSRLAGTQATEVLTQGTTASDVVNAQAQVQMARANLVAARADLVRIQSDTTRTAELAKQGVASQQASDEAVATLHAQEARVRAAEDQVRSAEAALNSALARTHQTRAAESTVAETRQQQLQAEAQRTQAQVQLDYTRVFAPISGIISLRVAREGEVVAPGAPIVTIIDLGETWVRAPLPETYADKIGIGDELKVRMPGGDIVTGKVITKGVEADFATQRDVSRRKRDIKTVQLKLSIPNPNHAFVPGMTAIVLVPKSKLN
ncbi:MAG TPA: efflux RND transporter periplasmic adaptor subunit [Terriglobales bacterium]|nr:efflux RND transporter periplasmic adaptor subunit [Terriglobales bacterium]